MLDALHIPLTLVMERGCPVEATVEVSALRPGDAAPLSIERVNIRGMLEDVGETFLFRGHLRGTFVSSCDRCLGEARVAADIAVTWMFEEGPEIPLDSDGYDEDESRDRYMFQGRTIDLAPAVWEELALAAPFKYVCREACAGLCARCGANLNEGPCGCPPDRDDPSVTDGGLAGLAALLPKLNASDTRS